MREKLERRVHVSMGALPSALGALLVFTAVAFGGSVVRPLADSMQTAISAELGLQPAGLAAERATPQADKAVADRQTDELKDPALKHRDPESKPGKAKPTEKPKPAPQPTAKAAPKAEPPAKAQPKQTEKPARKPAQKPAEEPANKPAQKPKPPSTPKPAPSERPAPYAMSLVAEQVGSAVVLNWDPSVSDRFVAYKVVRSVTNQSPTYPLNEGSELLAAIGDAGLTTFFDGSVKAGVTYSYRVLAMGNDGSWFALGISPVATVAVAEPSAG